MNNEDDGNDTDTEDIQNQKAANRRASYRGIQQLPPAQSVIQILKEGAIKKKPTEQQVAEALKFATSNIGNLELRQQIASKIIANAAKERTSATIAKSSFFQYYDMFLQKNQDGRNLLTYEQLVLQLGKPLIEALDQFIVRRKTKTGYTPPLVRRMTYKMFAEVNGDSDKSIVLFRRSKSILRMMKQLLYFGKNGFASFDLEKKILARKLSMAASKANPTTIFNRLIKYYNKSNSTNPQAIRQYIGDEAEIKGSQAKERLQGKMVNALEKAFGQSQQNYQEFSGIKRTFKDTYGGSGGSKNEEAINLAKKLISQ